MVGMENVIPEDENRAAYRAVKQSTGRQQPPAEGLEAAWYEWIASIQNVDARTRTLLRAAFEAGFEAGNKGLTK